jgi:hypothetical protein
MRRHQLPLQLGLIVLGAVLLAPLLISSRPVPAQAQDLPTPTSTPAANARPDRCEPNDTPARACVLQLDAVNGPFTFLPEGDADYYSVDLGEAPTGLALTVSVSGTPGLDLRTTISRAGDDEPLAVLSSGQISTTLPVELAGWLVLRVENLLPALPLGESYNLELRRVLPPPPPPPDALAARPALLPDPLENNWSPATAAPIGVGFVYELTFVCPVAWGCVGGDHDYLAVPVKAGVRYLIATFDLGPGVDTVIDLFWGDLERPLASNDDAGPGASFLSALHWDAPADGTLFIRIGPRTGGAGQVVFDEAAGSYRFAIALAGSDLARQLERRIAEQTNAPTATPRPAAGPVSGGATSPPRPTPVVSSDGPGGPAVVVADATALREGPAADSPVIQTLSQGAQVTLLGQASGGWVRVQPAEGVVPGWVYGPDLRRAEAVTPALAASAPTVEATRPTPVASAIPTPRPQPQVTRLDPLPIPPALPAAPRNTLAVEVTLLVAEPGAAATGSTVRPTPIAQQPLAGVRVQLVTALGDVLAEAVTPANGRVTLMRDVTPGSAVLLRIPALGIEVGVDPARPALTIVVPQENNR